MSSIERPSAANRLIVSSGPSSATGGSTALTRLPSGRRASNHRTGLVDAPADRGHDPLDHVAQVRPSSNRTCSRRSRPRRSAYTWIRPVRDHLGHPGSRISGSSGPAPSASSSMASTRRSRSPGGSAASLRNSARVRAHSAARGSEPVTLRSSTPGERGRGSAQRRPAGSVTRPVPRAAPHGPGADALWIPAARLRAHRDHGYAHRPFDSAERHLAAARPPVDHQAHRPTGNARRSSHDAARAAQSTTGVRCRHQQ